MKIIAGYYIIYDLVLLSSLSYYEYHTYNGIYDNGYYGYGGYYYGGYNGGYYGRRRNDSFWSDWFCIRFLFYLFSSISAADGAPITSEGLSLETAGQHAIASASSKPGLWEQVFADGAQTAGFILGVVAGVCYIASRIPQIRLNGIRKSCKGVSVLMFYFLFFANITYCLSVFFLDWLGLHREEVSLAHQLHRLCDPGCVHHRSILSLRDCGAGEEWCRASSADAGCLGY